jgi:peroxiredoxin/tetratricopeptide (TPR) repeat protein
MQPATSPQPDSIAEALDLADRDRVTEAIQLLKRSIGSDPANVRTHAAYIRIKTFYVGAYDDVRAEYDALLAREPNNPVYPMALVLGAPGAVPNRTRMDWYRRVSELTPDSAWGHYAKGQLAMASNPEQAEKELRAAIALEPSGADAYESLLSLEERTLKNLDGALEVARKMSLEPALADRARPSLWRLTYEQAGRSDEAKKALREELVKASASRELAVLDAVRITYAQVLEDNDTAKLMEKRLVQIDPEWYPQRGRVTFFGPSNLSGVSRNDALSGRAFALVLGPVREADTIPEAPLRLARLRELLAQTQNPVAVRFIREWIFEAAEAAGDIDTLTEDGQVLRHLDPDDAAVPARIALALSSTGDRLREALSYADAAMALTAEQRPIKRPQNTDAELFAQRCNAETQRRIFTAQRALALEARGRTLCLLGDCGAAEPLLREAVSLHRTERNLSSHAEALRKLGRVSEANAVAQEAADEFAANVRKEMVNEPGKDFRLKTIQGRTVTLESLRGKTVIISFWATWCLPCREEMPKLAQLYRQNASRGLEVLGVTTEEPSERSKIETFLQKYDVTFPILYADGVDSRYGVNGLPSVTVIGPDGTIRYRSSGFQGDKTMRALEIVVNELLKSH